MTKLFPCMAQIINYSYDKRYYTAREYTFNDLKLLEREPLRYCKCDGKVIFTRPFQMLGKVTLIDDHVNALERY